MRVRFFVEVLSRESQVVVKRRQFAGFFIRCGGAEGIAVPLPSQHVCRAQDGSWRVEVIRLHHKRPGRLDRRDRRVGQIHVLGNQSAEVVIFAQQLAVFAIHKARIRTGVLHQPLAQRVVVVAGDGSAVGVADEAVAAVVGQGLGGDALGVAGQVVAVAFGPGAADAAEFVARGLIIIGADGAAVLELATITVGVVLISNGRAVAG